MNTIGERLKELRKKEKLTQQQLADKLGCSHQSISCYENNRHISKIQDFIEICKYFDKDMYYLITGLKNNKGSEITLQEQQIISAYNNLIPNSDKQKIVNFIMGIGEYDTSKIVKPDSTPIYRFPVFYQSAAAGIGKLSETEEYQMKEFRLRTVPQKAVFGMYIEGHSMETIIYENDVVLIDPSIKEPSSLDDEIVVARFGEELICKKLMINEDNQTYDFISENPDDKDKSRFNQKQSDFTLIGKVVKIIHAHEIGIGIFTYSE